MAAQSLDLFLASIPESRRALSPELAAELAAVLERKLEVARATWAFEAPGVIAYIAARLGPGELVDALDALDVTSLYLACACASGSRAALDAFDAAMLREVDVSRAALRAPIALAEDVKQTLRQRLFAMKRIEDYAGTGELRTWFRVIATRELITELRKTRREVALEPGLVELASPAHDAELSLIRGRYHAQFKVAFEAAVETLSPRQRNLLRQQLVDGLSVEEIAAIYRAHRVTIARWLARARQDVWLHTRDVLARGLALSAAELETALEEIRSQLDLSLSRVLKPE